MEEEQACLARYGPDDDSFPAKVRRFEELVAELSQTKYALALNAGTSGLFLALVGLGIGPGDEVIVPGFTFVATISSVVYARARPVLAEVVIRESTRASVTGSAGGGRLV